VVSSAAGSAPAIKREAAACSGEAVDAAFLRESISATAMRANDEIGIRKLCDE
jgi:hypothetical protein